MRPPEPSGACLPPPKPAAPAPSGGRTPGCEPRTRGVPARGARVRPGAAGGTRKRRALPPPRNSGTRGAVPVAPRTGRRGYDPRATCPGGRTAATGRDEASRLRAGPAPSRRQPRRAAPLAGSATAHARGCAAPRAGPAHWPLPHIARTQRPRLASAAPGISAEAAAARAWGCLRGPRPRAHGAWREQGAGTRQALQGTSPDLSLRPVPVRGSQARPGLAPAG